MYTCARVAYAARITADDLFDFPESYLEFEAGLVQFLGRNYSVMWSFADHPELVVRQHCAVASTDYCWEPSRHIAASVLYYLRTRHRSCPNGSSWTRTTIFFADDYSVSYLYNRGIWAYEGSPSWLSTK